MKLKQRPEDFRVEEFPTVTPGPPGSPGGPFAFYRLEKRGWTTPDALAALRRRWKVDFRRLSYGGLKDRHAHTVQYLTILKGPHHGLTHHDVQLKYLGRVEMPYASQHIRANRFHLRLRDFTDEAISRATEAVSQVAQIGVPNYFDDQRFGSVAPGEAPSFVARFLVEGRFEEALRQALAGPYEHDRGEAKREKAILRECWGDWTVCKERLPRGHARSLVDYLVHHPTDFRGACARLRPDLRGLYLSAYQSYLWNRLLARWLEQRLPAEQRVSVSLRLGDVPMQGHLDESQCIELASLRLPLPTARLHLEASDPRLPLIEEVLREEGLELKQLKVKGVREMFFSKGERPALCFPAQLRHEVVADDVNPGRQALVLSFELPRGSYATLIVKRITPQSIRGPIP
jgi:tRNA pseudouridine13 synthase